LAADQVAARTAEQLFGTLGGLKGEAAKLRQAMPVFEAAMPEEVAATPSAGPVHRNRHLFYWLHTHAADGIIHVESLVQRTYMLGNFFNVWGSRWDRARRVRPPAVWSPCTTARSTRATCATSADRARADPAGRRQPRNGSDQSLHRRASFAGP
jgi:hypothetical protein